MKKLFTLLFIVASFSSFSQAPSGYYTSALGKNGTALRAALHNIIDGHTQLSYDDLWDAYYLTDKKPNGKVWDIYSDKPGGTAPYEFTFGTNKCGSYSSENDCYNREHTWPQSLFGGNFPMYSDLFLVYPTDGWVNNKRGNLPYGKVSSPSWTSLNGSKVGNNTYPGSPSGNSFEPIDSFKGDIARTYFYVVTRYYTEDGDWNNWDMSNKTELKPWAKAMLLEWHHLDPVSKKEIDRNNAVFAQQNNRNPFIDYPEMADCIFGTADCSYMDIADQQLERQLSIYPNPAHDFINVSFSGNELLLIEILDISGKKLESLEMNLHNKSINIEQLPKGMYILTASNSKGRAHFKFVK